MPRPNRSIFAVLSGVLLASLMGAALAAENGLLEPSLRVEGSGKTVAITLDACSGGLDHRVLDVLVNERIAATLFVTKRWIEANPKGFALFNAHPELFQIENHGESHIPAVLGFKKVYGILPAGTPDAIAAEVRNGAKAIMAHGAHAPHWYRGATALYSPAAIELIEKLGFQVAGFSLNADYGASASSAVARERMASAKNGDVVIAHINQPKRSAGAGIAQGLIDLKRAGTQFVRLDDVSTTAE